MNEFFQAQLDGLLQAIDLTGEAFSYKGQNYKGIISAIELSNEFKEAGLEEILTTRIVVPKAGFQKAPKSGETLSVNAQSMRIMKVDQDEVSYELLLATATK